MPRVALCDLILLKTLERDDHGSRRRKHQIHRGLYLPLTPEKTDQSYGSADQHECRFTAQDAKKTTHNITAALVFFNHSV